MTKFSFLKNTEGYDTLINELNNLTSERIAEMVVEFTYNPFEVNDFDIPYKQNSLLDANGQPMQFEGDLDLSDYLLIDFDNCGHAEYEFEISDWSVTDWFGSCLFGVNPFIFYDKPCKSNITYIRSYDRLDRPGNHLEEYQCDNIKLYQYQSNIGIGGDPTCIIIKLDDLKKLAIKFSKSYLFKDYLMDCIYEQICVLRTSESHLHGFEKKLSNEQIIDQLLTGIRGLQNNV